MAIISNSDFQAISRAYGNIQTMLNNMSGYLYSAVSTIALIDTVEPTFDLITDFYNSYNVNSNAMTTNVPLLAAVRKLNSHILNRGSTLSTPYTSIGATGDSTSYLTLTSQTVTASWASLSAAAGQTVASAHISG